MDVFEECTKILTQADDRIKQLEMQVEYEVLGKRELSKELLSVSRSS